MTILLLNGGPVDAAATVKFSGFFSEGWVLKTGGITVLNAVALAGGYTSSSDDNRRLQLDITNAHEELDLLLGNYWVAIATEARLMAGREERKSIRFPDKLLEHKADPKMADIIEGQTRIFNARAFSWALPRTNTASVGATNNV